MHYKSDFIRFFITASIIIYLFSCKNKSDDQFPVVQFIAPYENAFYSVFDTIPIKADISDNAQLLSIEVLLTDENFIPVGRSYSIPVKYNPMHLVFEYPVTDTFMLSGVYNLLIKVDDGTQTKHKYQKINISGITKQLIGIAVISELGGYKHIHIIDSNFTKTSLLAKNTDIVDLTKTSVISFHNRIAWVFEYSNKMEVWDYISKEKKWEIDNSNYPTGVLYRVNSSDKSFFTFIGDGLIKEYNVFGSHLLTINDSNYSGIRILKGDNYLITLSMAIKTPFTRAVRVYNKSSGNLSQTYTLDFNAMEIFDIGNNEYLIFGNSTTGGQIRKYNLQTNSLSTPKNFNGQHLELVRQVSKQEFLLQLNSIAYKLNTSNYGLLQISTIGYYEPVNNQLYTINSSNEIIIYDYNYMNQVGKIITTTGGIKSIEFLYNI